MVVIRHVPAVTVGVKDVRHGVIHGGNKTCACGQVRGRVKEGESDTV